MALVVVLLVLWARMVCMLMALLSVAGDADGDGGGDADVGGDAGGDADAVGDVDGDCGGTGGGRSSGGGGDDDNGDDDKDHSQGDGVRAAITATTFLVILTSAVTVSHHISCRAGIRGKQKQEFAVTLASRSNT